MASWQCVAVIAALFVVGASAQETVAAVTTLADNGNNAFVYVPTTTVEGEVSVSSFVSSAQGVVNQTHSALTSVPSVPRLVLAAQHL